MARLALANAFDGSDGPRWLTDEQRRELMKAIREGRLVNIAAMVSGHGRGSNFRAIVKKCERSNNIMKVVVLVSLNEESGAVAFAREREIPVEIVDASQFKFPMALDQEILQRLDPYVVSLICLGGYMRMLTPRFIREYPNRIMNIHPALLPAFGGKGMYGLRVHEAVIESGAKFSGATVHFVDEEYDHGPIILQKVVPVEDDDTPETLAARVLEAEHKIYPQAIELFALGRLKTEGRRVTILQGSDDAE